MPPARVACSVATTVREPAAGPSPAAPTLALLRLTDVDLPAADLAAVQLRDGLAGLARRAHLDEAEAARPSGLAVGDDARRLARSHLREQRFEVRAGGVEGKVADEYLLAHGILLPPAGRLWFGRVA